jgi:hypothetical protein
MAMSSGRLKGERRKAKGERGNGSFTDAVFYTGRRTQESSSGGRRRLPAAVQLGPHGGDQPGNLLDFTRDMIEDFLRDAPPSSADRKARSRYGMPGFAWLRRREGQKHGPAAKRQGLKPLGGHRRILLSPFSFLV